MKFKKPTPAAPLSPRAELERKYANSRANLWIVVVASFLNLIFIAFNGSYFLFAPSMPALLVELTLMEAGEAGVEPSALLVPIIAGVVMTLPYLLCAILSKKHVGWMVAALVFFSVDCVYLLVMFNLLSVIVDILFHAWIMFYLITGVINGFKLKNMPEDPLPAEGAEGAEATPDSDFSYAEAAADTTEDTTEADTAENATEADKAD